MKKTITVEELRSCLQSVDAIGDLTEGHSYIIRAKGLTHENALQLFEKAKKAGIFLVIVNVDFDIFEVHP